MSKKIIRLSSNQVLKQISNSQITNKNVEQPTLMRTNSALRGLEKPCGLFNPFEMDDINKDDQLLMDLLDNIPLDAVNNNNNDIENIENIENELMNNTSNSNISEQKTIKKQSNFAKKVKDLNMRINIPSKQVLTSLGSVESIEKTSPQFNRPKQITPDTETMYFQFVQSMPNINDQVTVMPDSSANLGLLEEFGTSEPNFEKLILGCTSAQITKMNDPFMDSQITNITDNSLTESLFIEKMDHEYIAKKRKISEDSVFDDSMNSDSFSDSCNESFPRVKNSRARGIYRADDVTNDEDLKNYLERRKKNNISSKISRANKKRAYNEMDSKCEELTNNNERLKTKIVELEKLNKIIKDLLVEKFTENRP